MSSRGLDAPVVSSRCRRSPSRAQAYRSRTVVTGLLSAFAQALTTEVDIAARAYHDETCAVATGCATSTPDGRCSPGLLIIPAPGHGQPRCDNVVITSRGPVGRGPSRRSYTTSTSALSASSRSELSARVATRIISDDGNSPHIRRGGFRADSSASRCLDRMQHCLLFRRDGASRRATRRPRARLKRHRGLDLLVMILIQC